MVSARLSFQFMHRNSHRTSGPTVNASSTTTTTFTRAEDTRVTWNTQGSIAVLLRQGVVAHCRQHHEQQLSFCLSLTIDDRALPAGRARSRSVQFHLGPICHSPALSSGTPKAQNVRPLVLHWSVPVLSLSELRNKLGVHPLEIKRRRRIWIIVLHPETLPIRCSGAPAQKLETKVSQMRVRALGPALIGHGRLRMPWLVNGIRCMMVSSASKSCGMLDTSPAAIFKRSA